MGRSTLLVLTLLTLAAVGLLLTANGCGAGYSQTSFSSQKIQHVVVIFQENRTPDNLFQDPVLITAGADIASSGTNHLGQTIPLTPVPLGVAFDLSHQHMAFVTTYDSGKMDGADLIPVNCEGGPCPPPNPEYSYVNPSDVQPYFQMAERYTFGDRMFQTNQGPSFPAHQFIISGTSAPSAGSSLFVSDNAEGVDDPGDNTGCTAPAKENVRTVDATGSDGGKIYPCTDHPALTDELDAKGITWRYYTPSAGSLWTGPNAIQHICGPNAAPPNATACTGPDWVNHVVLYTTDNPAPVLTDIANGQLPTVSWVIPDGPNSDHAGATTTTGGPSWVASIVNAIGNSPYWANTAIIVTWDDWGGWYDHVAPNVINDGISWGSGYAYGFRVPLVVISPYARPAYISHVNHDFGSILHFIEGNFGLQSLGYADAHADALSDCFNYSQTPLAFQTISAPLNADYFKNFRGPQTNPDDD